jgi:CheY-like chemotaxis protein
VDDRATRPRRCSKPAMGSGDVVTAGRTSSDRLDLVYLGRVALRVLIVDDQPEVRMLVRILLRLTHEVEIVGEAATRQEAIDMGRELRPDVIVLDLRLRGVADDGRELCSLIRQACPESRVIAFTAHSADKAWYQSRGVPVLSKEDTGGLVSAVLG